MKTKKVFKILLQHYETRLDHLKEEMGKQIQEIEELKTVAQGFTEQQLIGQQEYRDLENAYLKVQGIKRDPSGVEFIQGTLGWSVDIIVQQEKGEQE